MLQLTEPDLGPRPGRDNQNRPPVPGRIFETNIAYRIFTEKVECGFRTLVSEPVGTTQACEVYRLAFIKHLARDPLVGLRQGCWSLINTAHCLNGTGPIKALNGWLKDEQRMMPAVVFAEYSSKVSERLAVPVVVKADYNLPPLPPIENPGLTEYKKAELIRELLPALSNQEEEIKLPFDISKLAHYRMGYAQFFILPVEQLETFSSITRQTIRPGDILVFEPAAFGGEVIFYPYNYIKGNPIQVLREIEEYIQNYPKKKPMSFGNVAFLPEAKAIDSAKFFDLSRSKEELLRRFEEKLEDDRERHEAEIREKNENYDQLNRKLNRQNEQIQRLEASTALLLKEIRNIEKEHSLQLAAKDGEIKRLQAQLERPTRPYEVAEWVERHFTGKLIFHPRAKNEMQDVAPNKVDMTMVCNALEFLAIDYRDLLLGLIPEEEMCNRCTQKYGRPFEVIFVGEDVSAKRYPGDYKIKYYIGPKGRQVESPLNYHLRVGNDNERLLRIYFLYDKEKKLIVVGSLPGHLPTVSFK